MNASRLRTVRFGLGSLGLLGTLHCGADPTVASPRTGDDLPEAGPPNDATTTRPIAIESSDCTSARCAGAVQITWSAEQCARDATGAVFCSNTPTTNLAPPEGVVSMSRRVVSDAIALVAGAQHHCALHADGTVSCWGSNIFGSLGDPALDRATYAQPHRVPNLTEVEQLRSRDTFYQTDENCALRRDRSVYCWGGGWPSAATHVPELDGARDIVVDDSRACGLMSARLLRCVNGGDPGAEYEFDADIERLDAAWFHVCALGVDGGLRCVPISGETVEMEVGPVIDLASTIDSTCALSPRGQINCISPSSGRTGTSRRTLAGEGIALWGWSHQVCALLADGSTECWEP